MKDFKLFELPLQGAHLIEASAGTGKTYTLAALFLRLVVEQGIGVDRILVVTYTKAATEELKTRIRQRLLSAKQDWQHEKPRDPMLIEMRRRIKDSHLAIQRIQDALIDFDRAAIFTIHGFCQRVLQSFAFETGHLFKSELVQDDTPYIQEAAEDFWRRHIVVAHQELAAHALMRLGGPEVLTRTLALARFPNVAIFPSAKKPVLRSLNAWRDQAGILKDTWPKVRQEVKQLLQYEGLNARIYGNIAHKKNQDGPTPRQLKVENLCRTMDHWAGTYPLFKGFELLSTQRLALATKKKYTPPDHPFFDLCQQALSVHQKLVSQLDAYVRYLRLRFFQSARSRLTVKKERHNILFFDDLLLEVHQASTGPYGRMLADAVQSQYPVALVDEFQDTDQLQYEIFFHLFGKHPSLLAMIGDPKQAIYSFRGADVFSYLHAAQAAETRSTLSTNWRAQPRLLEAVNTIFDNHPQPFGFQSIGYEKAVAARPDTDDPSTPFRLWYLTPEDASSPDEIIPASVAVPRIAQAVAQEIVDLLNADNEPWVPEDVAVLVRTHRQAHVIKEALAAKGVPAVLHSAGSIYDSPEAADMERILAAVADPSNPRLVRAALASPMFGWEANDFLNIRGPESQQWENQWEAFRTYRQIWIRAGFHGMFRRLMVQEGIKKRVLSQPDGERAMTNLLHLAELLHKAESQRHLGPEGVLAWFAAQRQSEETGEDDQQLRLESDERAVRIITMHKSKGLQFKVVFCPYTWAGIATNTQTALFHDPDNALRLTLALGPDIPDDFQRQAQTEALAENLRMLYVALTRARQRCYWVWGRIKGANLSAPAYLLHGRDVDLQDPDWMTSLQNIVAGLTYEHWLEQVKALARQVDGSIEVAPLPEGKGQDYAPMQEPHGALDCRTAKRRLDRQWRISSFSAMTAGPHSPEPQPMDGDQGSALDAPGVPSGPANTLFEFPKGARAGLFFHDLLEHWEPREPSQKAWLSLVALKLQHHGYESDWTDSIGSMLDLLARKALETAHQRFAFKDVDADQRVPEMAFYFPLNQVEPSRLQEVFEQHAVHPAKAAMTQQLGRLHFAPMQGFMKGYIDLVFGHEERYYLVDWKSNYLGSDYSHYHRDTLNAAMTESYYFLQYHLYAVALDQWLRCRLPHYDYGQHFGGVIYIYLRGLEDKPSSSTGIYYDLPDARLMAALNQLLIANG